MQNERATLAKPDASRWARLLREGPLPPLGRQPGRYASRLKVDNYYGGRPIGLLGNRVRIDGLAFSVDSPSVATPHKSTPYFGYHEADERAMLRRYLPRDLPVVEIGGGIGVISCLANRRLDDPSKDVVIEANPGLIPVIERNRSLDRCGFAVLSGALAYDTPTIEFDVRSDSARSGGGADEVEETVQVATTTVEAAADGAGFDQFSVVCEIEGHDGALVDREVEVPAARVPFLPVEIHPWLMGGEVTARMLARPEGAGLVEVDEHGTNSVFAKPRRP